jgi:hypothetical protein
VEDEERVMQYMLLVYWDEGAQAASTKEQKAETFAAYSAYAEAMKKAGVHRAGHGLQATSTATVIQRTLRRKQRAAWRIFPHRRA